MSTYCTGYLHKFIRIRKKCHRCDKQNCHFYYSYIHSTYLEVPASQVHPSCANAHNCLGPTQGRWWNTEVSCSNIRGSASPRLAAVWLSFWNSDHVWFQNRGHTACLRLAQQRADLASGTLNVMKVESVTGQDGKREGRTDMNVELVM